LKFGAKRGINNWEKKEKENKTQNKRKKGQERKCCGYKAARVPEGRNHRLPAAREKSTFASP